MKSKIRRSPKERITINILLVCNLVYMVLAFTGDFFGRLFLAVFISAFGLAAIQAFISKGIELYTIYPLDQFISIMFAFGTLALTISSIASFCVYKILKSVLRLDFALPDSDFQLLMRILNGQARIYRKWFPYVQADYGNVLPLDDLSDYSRLADENPMIELDHTLERMELKHGN